MIEKLNENTNEVNGLETTHGYFKLDEKSQTKLDLRYYEKARVKWLYFTAMKPKNPQHRAWLNAIRGPAFGQPRLHAKLLHPLKHNVVATARKNRTVTPR
ncbi:Hypothetical predicted protein [Paramuricea clavata]|uniref:Uncharacterized protein n=1 Tax=Paramuricea clavata TaxID=317549 RepID=A0A6S7IR01_PARCT|nr:Hypothetical predicted protein [Paramuricea clavata]